MIQINGKNIHIKKNEYHKDRGTQWYFVYFPNKVNIKDLSKIKIDCTPEMRITNHWFRLFLSSREIDFLLKNYNISFKYISFEEKVISFSKENVYIGHFHKSFKPYNYNFDKIKKIYDSIYAFKVSNIKMLMKIPELLSIEADKQIRFENRWIAGYAQSKSNPTITANGFMTERYFNDRGIDGNGQIVTVLDSGLNTDSLFFYDQYFRIGVENLSSRKIVNYISYADNKTIDIHGTHVCGILAGNSICNNKQNFYDGIAPQAKINFIDIGMGYVIRNPDVLFVLDSMNKLKSRLSTNSWNSDLTIFKYSYEMACRRNPDKLFLFAAGNLIGYSSIIKTSSNKNSLTVGALETIYNSDFQSNNVIPVLQIEKHVFKLKQNDEPNYYFSRKGIIKKKLCFDINLCSTDSSIFVTEELNLTHCELTYQKPIDAIITKFFKCNNHSMPIFIYENISELYEINDTANISFILKENIKYTRPKVASYSSKGPSENGIMKPDVVAPGTYVFSASSDDKKKNCNDLNLIHTNGTSMSTPLVAGIATLIDQYFKEGYYPNGKKEQNNSLCISGNLLRGLVIASADPLEKGNYSPTLESGYGAVSLANIIDFTNDLKIFDNVTIDSKKEKVLKFNVVKSNKSLRIVMTFLDDPSNVDFIALNNDIDMYLILPNSTILYGNSRKGNVEEHFSTSERFLIPNEDVINGKYEIHFVSNTHYDDVIDFSLCISGNIDNDINNYKWETQDKKKCNFPEMGVNCQIKAIKMESKPKIIQTIPLTPIYLYYKIDSNQKIDNYTIKIKKDNGRFKVIANFNNIFKKNVYPTVYQSDYETGVVFTDDHIYHYSKRFKIPMLIGVMITSLSPNGSKLSIEILFNQKIKGINDENDNDEKGYKTTIAIISVLLFLYVVVLSSIYVYIQRRNDAITKNNMHNDDSF